MAGKRTRAAAYLMTLALCAAFLWPVKADANSAQRYWYGMDSYGAIVVGEDCPVTVAGERLTLNVPDFPQYYYDTAEELASYKSAVTAEYTFENPSELDAVMTVVFPFGTMPDYASIWDSTMKDVPYDNYSITADGEELQKKLRHTFTDSGYSGHDTDVDSRIASLMDEKKSDGPLRPDAPVRIIYYDYENIALNKGTLSDNYFVETSISGLNREKTAIICRYVNYNGEDIEGIIDEGGQIQLIVVGEPLEKTPVFEVYKDWKSLVPIGTLSATPAKIPDWGEAEPDMKTFDDFMMWRYDEDGAISETDYYNICFDYMMNYSSDSRILDAVAPDLYYNYYNILCWYEYELTVPAKGRVVNSVTAPLYPTIDGSWDPDKYMYTYLLSPATKWADFGTFEAEILTPYYISGSTLDFEKTATGYRYTSDGLPDGELEFILCASEHPKAERRYGCLTSCALLAAYTCSSCLS